MNADLLTRPDDLVATRHGADADAPTRADALATRATDDATWYAAGRYHASAADAARWRLLHAERAAAEDAHATAWLDRERAKIGEWWFRQEYLTEFVATDDQVFSYESVMGALSPDLVPLFGAARAD